MRRGLWIGLFVLALAVRLVGLDFDQGHFYHPDERAIGDAILKLSFRPLALNPHFFAYGSFPLYVTKAVSSALAAVTGRPWLSSYDGVIHVGRFLSAVWGALTVLLLALLGRRWYGEKAGLLAGVFLALAVLHIQTSHFAATDVALTFLVLLALACASRLAHRGRPRDAVVAGAVTGLALATKASAAPLLLPLAVAVFFATKDRRAFGRAAALLAAAGAAALAVFALGEPYAFLDARAFWRSVAEQGTMVRHAGVFPFTNQYVGVPDFLYEGKELVLWGLGPLLGIAALWATLARLARVKALGAREWVLASFLVPYVLITCTFEVKFPRYLLPVYPILLLWAGAWLSGRAERGRGGRILRAAVVGGTAVWALAFVSIYTRPHSAVTASRWFHEHVPDGAHVLEEDWDEGFPFSFEGRPAERYAIDSFGFYEPDSPAKMAKLAAGLAKADWVVLQTKRLYGAVTRAPAKFPLTNRAFRLLFAGDLGFVLEKDVASRPSLFGIEVPDELADESFSVYDHPKALIFRNEKRLGAPELERLLLLATPSKTLSRSDLLLARAKAPPGGAAAAAGSGLPARGSPFLATLLFAGFLEILGLAGYALLSRVLPERPGLYALGKVLGALFYGFGAWLLVACRWAPFSRLFLLGWAFLLAAAGWRAVRARPFRAPRAERAKTELVVWGTFLFFLAFRAMNPEIYSGEKPMDFAFLNTLLRARSLPPPEPWLAGTSLSYTYFGHFVVAALGKALSIFPGVLFNLGIAGVAALTAAGVLAAGAALGGRLRAGGVAVVLALFWAPPSGVREAVSRWRGGQPLDWHYFWATSRVIPPNAINEYPIWSFLFADLHAHVLAMPFTAAFLALLLLFVTRERPLGARAAVVSVGLLGLLFAAIQITNGWAIPTYVSLLVFVPLAAFLSGRGGDSRPFPRGLAADVLLPALGAVATAWLLSRPFWSAFVPPPRNWGRELGPWAAPWDFANVWAFFAALLVPFVFLILWRSSRSPRGAGRVLLVVAAAALLLSVLRVSFRPLHVGQAASAGAFTCVAGLVALAAALRGSVPARERVAASLVAAGFAILTGCEVVYVWDRMNTVFKFHLETWFLFAVAGAAAWAVLRETGGWTWKALVGVTGAASLFTLVTAVPGFLKLDRGGWPRGTLDGTAYLATYAPGDRAAYEWINANVRGIPVILEAQGPAYQDFSRYSMMTGLPTVQGWEYHVQQRGHSTAETDRRKADVTEAYSSHDEPAVAAILKRYNVALVVVGPLERKTYGEDVGARFDAWSDVLSPVYRNREVTLFAVKGVYAPGGTATLVRVEELPAAAPVASAEPERHSDPPGRVRQPRGLASDAQGRIWVADFGNDRIQSFSDALAPLLAFGQHGTAPGSFKDPCGVAVGPGGLVYVADTWNGRVQVFGADGTWRREFAGDFFGPRGIAVDARGRVFVADTGNNRIVRFGPTGLKEKEWGRADGPGHLAGPNGLALAPDGSLWVADNENGRAAAFTADGVFVTSFPVPGWRRETFSEPYVAVDAKGIVWVSVPLEGEIRAYTSSGRLLVTARGKDQPEGKRFEKPSGLALLPGGRLAVADLEGRIVVITLPR